MTSQQYGPLDPHLMMLGRFLELEKRGASSDEWRALHVATESAHVLARERVQARQRTLFAEGPAHPDHDQLLLDLDAARHSLDELATLLARIAAKLAPKPAP